MCLLFLSVVCRSEGEGVYLLALKHMGIGRRRRGVRVNRSSWVPSSMSLLLPPLLILLIIFADGADSVKNDTSTTRRVSSLRMERIHRHLEKINKPAVRSIESPDGDTIDCIPQHKQPALDHPLLKDHKLQRAPTGRPRYKDGRMNLKNYTDAIRGAWQSWHRSGHCPRGTVPVRRTSVTDVLRAKSLYHYGRKQGRLSQLARSVNTPDVVSGNGHEHAIAYTGSSQEVYGAKATINVWEPSVQATNEFSLSQIWVLSGSFDGSDLNSIEAGWQVSPELYGDSRPRLFTYWTSDAYQATGCYNLLCSGFIQTNNKIAIGAAISPISNPGGSQFDITILIWKDPKLGNWWMSFGETALVGYWPAELFSHLSDHATMVEWGGEVVNMRPDGVHTSTQMGSGHFAEDGFGRAGYFRNLEIVDSDNSLTAIQSISTLADNPNCYDIKSSSSSDWGTYFYFGGPGNNPKCQ